MAREAQKDVVFRSIVLRVLVYVVQMYGDIAVHRRARFAFAADALPPLPCGVAIPLNQQLPLVANVLGAAFRRASEQPLFVPSRASIGAKPVPFAVERGPEHPRSTALDANAGMSTILSALFDPVSLVLRALAAQRLAVSRRFGAADALATRLSHYGSGRILVAADATGGFGGILSFFEYLKNSTFINLRHAWSSRKPNVADYMYTVNSGSRATLARLSLI